MKKIALAVLVVAFSFGALIGCQPKKADCKKCAPAKCKCAPAKAEAKPAK